MLVFSLNEQNQITDFKNNAKEKQVLLMKTVGENIGDCLEDYINHIQYRMLVEESNDTEVLKFVGKRFMNFEIKVGNVHDTTEWILIPELITM